MIATLALNINLMNVIISLEYKEYCLGKMQASVQKIVGDYVTFCLMWWSSTNGKAT